MENTFIDYYNRFKGFFAVFIPCVIGWIITYLAIYSFELYGYFLFLFLPFIMGVTTSILYRYKNNVQWLKVYLISTLTLVIYSLGLIFFSLEGIICLIMAFPIGLLMNGLGCSAGYNYVKKRFQINVAAILIFLTFSLPVLMAFESISNNEDEIRSVTTSIEINASPEIVWKNVVVFPQLEEPTEFIFKAGIAYPINAKINGHGVGAIRYCNFSTGSFVEPITMWDEPNVLGFDVTEQPAPMKELSPYDIHPKHLDGYWASKRGEFKLTKLPNGNTRIDGTTWYVNKIKPDFYWALWSDYIVHTIHERVLEHIKIQSENIAHK